MKNYYTLEYSPAQKCFHYDQISDMINSNLEACIGKRRSDYICVGIFKTRQERQETKDRLDKLFRG